MFRCPILEQLFVKLRRGGLVESVRGPTGRLPAWRGQASEIRVVEILAAVDETVDALHNRGRCLGGVVGQPGAER